MLTLALASATALAASAAAPSTLPPASSVQVDFVRDIQPILSSKCVGCHGPEKQKNGLRIDQQSAALRGGDSGKVILPGHGAESLMLHRLAGVDPEKTMPPKGERLTAEQIGIFRAWIDQGAPWPEDPGSHRKRSEHWSFQILKNPAIPPAGNWESRIRTPVDPFIFARLKLAGLEPMSVLRKGGA